VVDVRNDGKVAQESGVHGCGGQCLILTGSESSQFLAAGTDSKLSAQATVSSVESCRWSSKE
jgi:hypothetical protein